MDEQSGETEKEEVIDEGIGESEVEELVPEWDWRRYKGSWFQRLGEAYRKERSEGADLAGVTRGRMEAPGAAAPYRRRGLAPIVY